jgi:phosphoglycerate kinase
MGPKSLQDLEDMCKAAKTIVWNGPVGVFEIPPFDAGSRAIGKILARLTKEGVTTIAGGGDTLAALGKDKDALSYVSTAGGAFLEWLEGRELPGVSILYRHVR